MIYCLTGKIVKKSMNAVVLSCGGVGYYAQCPHMPAEARTRLQQTLERIINDGCDGLICILL